MNLPNVCRNFTPLGTPGFIIYEENQNAFFLNHNTKILLNPFKSQHHEILLEFSKDK